MTTMMSPQHTSLFWYKDSKEGNISECFNGAAATVMKAQQTARKTGRSPGASINLRMKNFGGQHRFCQRKQT